MESGNANISRLFSFYLSRSGTHLNQVACYSALRWNPGISKPVLTYLCRWYNVNSCWWSVPLIPRGETSVSLSPHSLRNEMATSTLSSVGRSSSRVSISKHKTSWAWGRSGVRCSTNSHTHTQMTSLEPDVDILTAWEGEIGTYHVLVDEMSHELWGRQALLL